MTRLSRSVYMLIAAGLAFVLLAVCASSAPGTASSSPPRNSVLHVPQDSSRDRPLAVNAMSALESLRGHIDHDFGATPGPLTVQVFSSHRAFARALWRLQRVRPQTAQDNNGGIVHGVLLLGPLPRTYLRHSLAHVYTEWVMDRLSGNLTDRLPDGTWLYDGLAEYEAYRYAPGTMKCAAHGPLPFDVTTVRTARRWMAIRPGPLGDLEYCLAYLRVRHLVKSIGWPSIVRTLRAHGSWTRLARRFRDASGGALMSQPAP